MFVAESHYDIYHGEETEPLPDKLVVRLHRPEMSPEKDYWRCKLSLVYAEKSAEVHAPGGDGVHALLNALQLIPAAIKKLGIPRIECVPPELLFPKPVPASLGEEFYFRMVKLIDKEIEIVVDNYRKS